MNKYTRAIREKFRDNKLPIISFVLIIIFVHFLYVVFALPDDRGYVIKDLFQSQWIVADFVHYQKNPIDLISSFINGQYEWRPGPVLPILISISKFFRLGLLIVVMFSIVLGIINIILIEDYIKLAFRDLDLQNIKIKLLSREFKLLQLSLLFGYSLNPIIIYYSAFPSTDTILSSIFIFILTYCSLLITKTKTIKNNFLINIFVLILSLFLAICTRPTGIIVLPIIVICYIHLISKVGISMQRLTAFLLPLLLILSMGASYYKPYFDRNISASTEKTLGKTSWQTPLASISKENRLKKTNVLAHLFTVPLKLPAILGIRPTYNSTTSSYKKPYIYAYMRITIGLLIFLPSFYLYLFNCIIKPNWPKLLLLLSILFVPVLLTYSIALERYALHCLMLLSSMYIIQIYDIYKVYRSVKNNSE